MKTILPVLFLLLFTAPAWTQITMPIMKAGFGVDGELRSNFFNNIMQSGNDDWFRYNPSFGTGRFVIDTTGAAAIMADYISNPDSRKIPFFRTMSAEPYSLMNSYRVIDAVFIRDYHGTDSTIFAGGSNKNGMSPANWTCPIAQSIPDKNEILDMMVHVRRAGPGNTDSLWMFGGLSIENNVGNRYFDFEMYQTDIYYDRASLRFYGYGPDDGHTAWLFDAAGNVTRPGDITFAAEYSSSTLSGLEVRIWINKASLSITPTGFSWSGSFDGASSGSQYGYASITPNTVGAFYTGLSSSANTWAGPFGLVKGDNSLVSTYAAAQFMEFSVNLTKLGLDPVTLLGGDDCGMPFRRVLVKTRSSTSFTSELKDFVGPFDFFLAPRAEVAADIPYYCGTIGVSELQVLNPVSTSTYAWSTLDGNITGSTDGPSTFVNYPGTYIVTQKLQDGCAPYATDTVVITYDAFCSVLEFDLVDFRGIEKNGQVSLQWTVENSEDINRFIIERSQDGTNFSAVQEIPADGKTTFTAADAVYKLNSNSIYYRLKVVAAKGKTAYTKIIQVKLNDRGISEISLVPNPTTGSLQIQLYSPSQVQVQIFIYNINGAVMKTWQTIVTGGFSTIPVSGAEKWSKGIYPVKVLIGNKVITQKIVLNR